MAEHPLKAMRCMKCGRAIHSKVIAGAYGPKCARRMGLLPQPLKRIRLFNGRYALSDSSAYFQTDLFGAPDEQNTDEAGCTAEAWPGLRQQAAARDDDGPRAPFPHSAGKPATPAGQHGGLR